MPDIYYYEFEVITQNNEIKKFNKLDYFLNVVKNDTNNFVFAKYSEKQKNRTFKFSYLE